MKAEFIGGIKREYNLIIDRKDLFYIGSYTNGAGVCSDYARNGVKFALFYHPDMTSEFFEQMPQEDFYYLYISAYDSANPITFKDFIQRRAQIPIKVESSVPRTLRTENQSNKLDMGIVRIVFNEFKL